MTTIKVILGSTRPGRFGIQPAEWIMDLSKAHPESKFELVDLADLNLPLLDEPMPASMQKYTKDHTKKWAEIVDSADGFIFVTAEYNHSIPGALKNAIDFLSREWMFKPVAYVSYGADAGGTRAIEQLRQIAGWHRMYDLGDFVSLANYWAQLDKDGKFTANELQTQNAEKMLNSIIFWSEKMKPARQELGKQS